MAHGRQEIALEPIGLIERHICLRQLVHLHVEIRRSLLRSRSCMLTRLRKHAVESMAEIFKLIAVEFRCAHSTRPQRWRR